LNIFALGLRLHPWQGFCRHCVVEYANWPDAVSIRKGWLGAG
jgi:hypothetical protein